MSGSNKFRPNFVKRLFKLPRLSYSPWYRVCDRRSQIWDLISSSFQPRPLNYMLLKFYYQSLRWWVHLSSSSFFYFNLSYTKCSFAYLPSRYLVQKQGSRIRRPHKVRHNLIYNRLFSDPSHLIRRCKSIHLIACSSWKFDDIATLCIWDHKWH